MTLALHNLLTLDGVMQAPRGPGEDPDGGFEHVGSSSPHRGEELAATMARWRRR